MSLCLTLLALRPDSGLVSKYEVEDAATWVAPSRGDVAATATGVPVMENGDDRKSGLTCGRAVVC